MMTPTGRRIYKARMKLHITQAKLGEMIGSNMETIDKYEQGFIPEDSIPLQIWKDSRHIKNLCWLPERLGAKPFRGR